MTKVKIILNLGIKLPLHSSSELPPSTAGFDKAPVKKVLDSISFFYQESS